MSREEAISMLMVCLLDGGLCGRLEARGQAEDLIAASMSDPLYRIEGVEVPEEFVAEALASL